LSCPSFWYSAKWVLHLESAHSAATSRTPKMARSPSVPFVESSVDGLSIRVGCAFMSLPAACFCPPGRLRTWCQGLLSPKRVGFQLHRQASSARTSPMPASAATLGHPWQVVYRLVGAGPPSAITARRLPHLPSAADLGLRFKVHQNRGTIHSSTILLRRSVASPR